MPDVGLTTATNPLPKDDRVVIKYSVEVEGLSVYQESYDARKLAGELKADPRLFARLWLNRVECVVENLERDSFSARITGCLADRLNARRNP